MAETRFSMSIEPCAVVQAEGWPATLPAFEAELSRQLGGKLPAAFGEAMILPRLQGRGTAEGGGGGDSTDPQLAQDEWLAVRIALRRFWFIADEKSNLHCSIDPELGCLLPLNESRLRLRLSGPHTFDILAACVAIDWHEAKPGHAFQTSFHHVPVLALRTAADACDLLSPSSFARSLAEWVADIAAPYEERVSARVPA